MIEKPGHITVRDKRITGQHFILEMRTWGQSAGLDFYYNLKRKSGKKSLTLLPFCQFRRANRSHAISSVMNC